MTVQVIRRQITDSVSFSAVRALILLLALLALLGVVYLAQSTQATVTGQHIQELRERLDRLDRESNQIEYDIAVQTTPAKIAERAKLLGLHPPLSGQTIFVQVKNYPVTPIKPAVPPPSPTTSSDESFIAKLWGEFLTQLGLTPSIKPVEAGQ